MCSNDYYHNKINSDYVLQKYVKNDNCMVGHYLVINGNIHFCVYYKKNIYEDFFILKARITNYEKVNFIYDNIIVDLFQKINYTGFASIDFTFVNNIIILYEINPRIGGSLVNDENDFEKIINIILENNIFNCV